MEQDIKIYYREKYPKSSHYYDGTKRQGLQGEETEVAKCSQSKKNRKADADTELLYS